MKIYMRDGRKIRIKTETLNDLEVDVGTHPGYVHIKKYYDKAHVAYYTLLTIPKESLICIDYDTAEDAGVILELIGNRDSRGG